MMTEAVSQEGIDILWGLLMLFTIVVVVVVELHFQRRQEVLEDQAADHEERLKRLEGR